MQYYEDMRTKFGFAGGNSVPHGAEEVRTLYVTAINYFAQRDGSEYRAVAYDRPGLHNYCLILFIPVTAHLPGMDLGTTSFEQQAFLAPFYVEFGDTDDILKEAVDHAENQELDQYVSLAFSVDFEEFNEHRFEDEE